MGGKGEQWGIKIVTAIHSIGGMAAGTGPPVGNFFFQKPHICVFKIISATTGSFEVCMLRYLGPPNWPPPPPQGPPPPRGPKS